VAQLHVADDVVDGLEEALRLGRDPVDDRRAGIEPR
jgi:hypothetical protein